MAASAHRVGIAAVRHSRLARAANVGAMEALEPLHDELAMSPVGRPATLVLALLAAGSHPACRWGLPCLTPGLRSCHPPGAALARASSS